VRWTCSFPPEGGAVEYRLGRDGSDVVAEWTGLATFRARVDGSGARLDPLGDVEPAELERQLGPVLAALLGHLRGEIALHASSVARRDVAIAFLGDTCAGKSTIASRMCLDPDVALLADDVAPLRHVHGAVWVQPSESEHELRPDVARAVGLPSSGVKTRLRPARRAERAARLGACVVLSFDDAATVPAIERLPSARAFAAVARATMRFVVDEPDVLRAELDALARVVAQAPVYVLRRSRDLANLDVSAGVAARLLRSIAGEPESGEAQS
jgi:hypothetical protein